MRTELTFIAAAALLHAGLPLLARIAPNPLPAMLARSSREVLPIDVEVVETEPLKLPTVAPDPVTPEAATTPPDRESPPSEAEPHAGAVVPGGRREAGATAPDGNPPPDGTAAQPGSEYGPAPGGDVLHAPAGLGGPEVWKMPGMFPEGPPPPAPTVATRPRAVDPQIATKVLNEAMRANDKARGLDLPAAGTVASAIREVVQSSDTPAVSRATFEIRLGPNGQVLGVRVVSSNAGDAGAWARAAQAAAGRLAGRGLVMTGEYARGAIVTVDVNSVEQVPSGNGSGLSGAGATFDVSNIGAHKTRVVRTSHRIVALR